MSDINNVRENIKNIKIDLIEPKDVEENNRKKIIFDTNFLFIPFKFKIDIIRELDRVMQSYELFIIDKTLEELEKIKQKNKKDKKYINLINKFLQLYNFKIIKTDLSLGDYVDDILLNLVENNDFIIATMDKELREKLGNKSKKCLVFRQKSYLEFE